MEGVSGLDINKTEVLICVQERSATGAIHKVPAIELSSFLWNQQPPVMMQTARGQLSTLGVVSCVPRVRPTPEQLREYLASPAGIDARIWKQAQSENPDRDNFIPIPLIGFGDLVRHLHLQVFIKVFETTFDGLNRGTNMLISGEGNSSTPRNIG